MIVQRQCFFCGSFLLFVSVFVFVIVLSVPCSLVITCLGRLDLFDLLFVVLSCNFVTFLYSSMGWVWYLIISIPDSFLLPSMKDKEALFNVAYLNGQRKLC